MAGVQIDGVNNKIDFDDDLDTSISANVDDTLQVEVGGASVATLTASTIVFNEASADIDFRVESNGNANMLFVDGGNDRIAIGTTNVSSGAPLSISSGFAKTDTTSRSVFSIQSNDASAQAQLKVMNIGGASAADRKWQFQTSESGVANAGQLEFQVDGGSVQMGTTGGGHFFLNSAATVFNEGSTDTDFRIESNGNANMLFVDGGNNHVNIGTATDLGGTLNVNGVMTMAESDTVLLRITSSGSNIKFQSRVSDKDIRFEGIDGGSDVTALHLDMSANGLAIFSDGIQTNGDSRINSGNNNNQALQIGSSDDNKEAIRIIHSDADNPRGIVIAYTGGSPDSAGADKFISCSDTGAERFHVDAAGDILADGVANASDERLKENIADATAKWNDIKALKVRNFTWKAEHHPNRTHKHIGFIAQEFETVFPALVKERNLHPDPTYVEADKDADGNLPEGKEIGDAKNTKNMKTIHTTAMIPMLTKALQEAMAKIEDLEARVTTLEG